MNTISSRVLRIFAARHVADPSLRAVSLLSCFGLFISLGLIGLGFDLGGSWL
jgi:hypothetical protein